jgi:RimJ/RimL family protein N-acetyltransferase
MVELVSPAFGLVLRELSLSDAVAYHQTVQANRDFLTRLGDYIDEVEVPVDELARRFEDPADHSLKFGIWIGGGLVGHVALVHREPPRWGLGYWLSEAATGRGLATDAVACVLAHARNSLGATEVLAGVTHANVKSVGVLERLGFTERERFDTYTRYGLAFT